MREIGQWGTFCGMIAFAIVLALMVRKRIGWVGASLLAWVLVSALRVFQAPEFVAPLLRLELDHTSGQAFSQALLIPLVVFGFKPEHFRHWKRVACGFMVLEIGLGLVFNYGLLNAISFDGGWVAAMIPFAPLWLIGASVLFFLKVRGATAFLVLFAQLLAHGRFARKKSFYALLLVALPLLAWFSQGAKLWNDSERVQTWERSFRWLVKAHGVWAGAGIGTFHWVGPILQRFHMDLFVEMHNDWLQVLFEAGIIGFILLVVFYGQLLWKARGRPPVLVSLEGLGALCLTYHPLHYFPSAVWIACLVRETLEPGGVRQKELTW